MQRRTDPTAKGTVAAVKYMRYSTHNQDDGYSIAYQREAIEKYAAKNNIVLVNEYIDEARSGTNDRRPGLQSLMNDAKQKPDWNTVIVFDNSRFSRNLKDSVYYEKQLEDLGIKLLSVTQTFSDNADGRLCKNLLRAIYSYQPDKTAERVSATQELLASEASHLGGKPPLGYKLNADKQLVIDSDTAPIIKEIFDMYEVGYSYANMAKILNQKGYQTASDNPFTKHSFNSILRQEKYTGKYIWNKSSKKKSGGKRNSHTYKPEEEWIIKENAFEPIISKEQFERVQNLMKERSRGTSTTKARRFYMLSGQGFLKCSCCGSLMVGSTVTSHGKKYPVYRCPKHKGNVCPTKDIPAASLDKFVSVKIAQNSFKGIDLQQLSEEINASNESYRTLNQELRQIRKQLTNIAKSLSKCYSDALTEEVQRLEERKAFILQKMDAAKSGKISIDESNLRDLKEKVFQYLRTSDDLEARRYLKTIVKQIVVSNEEVTVELNIA